MEAEQSLSSIALSAAATIESVSKVVVLISLSLLLPQPSSPKTIQPFSVSHPSRTEDLYRNSTYSIILAVINLIETNPHLAKTQIWKHSTMVAVYLN